MKIPFFVFLILLSANLFAQSFVISADKMNIAYIGIDNPLSIVSDNCSCKDLFATTDNGTLIKKDSCHFLYEPSQAEKATIIIQKKQNGKLVKIGEQVLRCKRIPDPYPVVGNRHSGSFPLAQFKVQQGVVMTFGESFDLDFKAIVISFKITLLSNNQVFHTQETNGNRFTSNTIVAFSQLKTGDIVAIEGIKCIRSGGCPKGAGTLTFVMR
ncbi:hypothetical protein F0919_01110 [Taibaiella lutea]|uniref:Uncharacterized protein n=1 Tax=Taibaiella lutea TaxID=2608001 RepID=A0A5M6CMR5_9BACT|nr:GldM family protein [Taibaiella lutea]KAA5536296.1 hypothetical protein F0919_01110 [Taibaiella lutea]